MSLLENDNLLPGAITEIKSEYSTGYDTSKFGTTDSVCVMGTAFDGPVGVPVKIYSPEHAKYVFGKSFDYKTRKEATLVSEIQNAWDRGCRTIYAVRISGDSIHKDFKLATGDLKLRVEGIFPSNKNKSVFFHYDAVDTISEIANGEEASIKIYKPAERATIEEKMQGKVTKENAILVNTVKIKSNWNISKGSRLVDFVRLFNNYRTNNVLKLSIVDEDGNNVTETIEAQTLAFGDLIPGIYFIGRDRNAQNTVAKTIASSVFVKDEDRDLVYEGFEGNVFTTLKLNTDVTSEYPVYAKDAASLNACIDKIDSITMSKLFDFLEVSGKVDSVWLQDKNDYEKVNLKDFEKYMILGSGFANTARIVETKQGTGIYKVEEVVSENDLNKVVPITEGIYSVLENLKTKYRVLTCADADKEIKGKLPKKSEFLMSNPKTSEIFSNTVSVTSKLEKNDISAKAKTYSFELRTLSEDSHLLSAEMIVEELSKTSGKVAIAKYALDATTIESTGFDSSLLEDGDIVLFKSSIEKKVNGRMVTCEDKSEFVDSLIVTESGIFKVTQGQSGLTATAVTSLEDIAKATLILAEIRGEIAIFKVKVSDAAITSIEVEAMLSSVMNEEDIFTVILPVISKTVVTNKVVIKAPNLDITSLSELVIAMSNASLLKKKFEFNIGRSIPDAAKYYSVIPDIFEKPASGEVINTATSKVNSETATNDFIDRGLPIYDKSIYIPFKTGDNFARQLAQHCTYTSIKTSPTHGIIGCKKLLATNLKAVADKVEVLANTDFNLYAKKGNGNDMLDRNNMPYPIGRNVSVVFFQNRVEAGDNYTFLSSGAAAYAGMISVLPVDSSSTFQAINAEPTFELSNYQLGRLTQAGFVTIKNSYTKGYTITDGITMAPITSPFRRLSVTRIINTVDEAIRGASEPFIGKQNSLAARNSLQTAIKSKLDLMIEKIIEKYNFKLIVDRSAEKMGIINIEYNVIPLNEIREVRNTISVKDN